MSKDDAVGRIDIERLRFGMSARAGGRISDWRTRAI